MPIRTSLSEDTTSAALNTKAHASEHCAIDPESLDVLNSAVGRQVLVTRSAKRRALYTVVARIDVSGPAARVGTAGLARVVDPTGEPPAPKLKAALETDFLGGESTAPVRLTEELLGRAATGLAVMAPHGGRIEPHTDDQARAVYKLLAKERKPARAWIAQGFNPAARTPAGTSPHRRSPSVRSPGSARSSAGGRRVDRSPTRWHSTARTTPTRSSSAEGCRRTRSTPRSRRGSEIGSATPSGK